MDLKNLIGDLAPTIAATLGGPLAGTGVKALAKMFGCEPTEEDITKQFMTADTDKLKELKELDHSFKIEMKKLNIDVYKIDAEDRANARQREIATGDNTPKILAYLITFGFFSVLLFIVKYGLPENGRDATLLLLGALSGAWTGGVVSYYFGSSKGSKDKTQSLIGIK